MTGELKVRFRHVVEIGRPMRVRARLEQEGEIRATASARFMEMPSEGQEKGE